MANIPNVVLELKNNLGSVLISDPDRNLYWVVITHITNPDYFFVRHYNCFQFIKHVESTAPSTRAIGVTENDLVVFNKKWTSNIDIQYVRGRVTRIYNDGSNVKCDIFTLDYGSLERAVPLEQLWACDQNYSDLPPLAIHCRLANCCPLRGQDWSAESIEAFVFYVGQERARLRIVERAVHQLTVELYNTNPDDIGTMMALTGYSTMGYVHPTFN